MKLELLTKESVAARLENLGSARAEPPVDENLLLWQYREAAAVLSSFDPGDLKPLTNAKRNKDSSTISALIGDTYLSFNSAGDPVWSLRNDVRLSALKRLGSPARLSHALQANPSRPKDTLQTVFESYINGRAKPLSEMSRDELSSALQSCQWLRNIVPNLPEEAAIRRQLDLVTLLAPLRSLTGSHFRGRQKELERLRSFVFDPKGQPFRYLAVCGVGGAGKSTLLAKFLLNHASLTNNANEHLAFVYLDFDRSTLSADQPTTILMEALRQLEIQFPEHSYRLRSVRDAWLSPDLVPPVMETYGSGSFVESDVEERSAHLPHLSSQFARLVGQLGIPKLLFVLDTFEEVQYLGSQFVENVYALLSQLRSLMPSIATIFATRTPLLRSNTEILSVNELDLEAALGFLAAHGISDHDLAREIVTRIGGNPLSLTLAASVVRMEGRSATETFATFDVQHELVQGQLYRRILQHIHNPDVRKLAHPGLVVRKITPDVILQVLAKPCEVPVKDRTAAVQLFQELKREDTLVQLSEDGGVTHREDVRQVMLSLLVRDMPTTVRKIHLAAVRFYQKRTDTASRAEEIYHRLCLDQDPAVIEKRWMDGIETQLRSAIFELPLRAKHYLASKLEMALDEELTQTLTLIGWENDAERRVLFALRFGQLEEALKILRERKGRSQGSRLPLLEAQVLERLKRIVQARSVAEKGLANAENYGDGNLILDYLSFLGAFEASARRWKSCKDYLDRALVVANSLGNRIRQLEVAVTRLILLRNTKILSVPDRQNSRDALAAVFWRVPARELSKDSSLAFDVAGELGAGYPDVVKRVILNCGLPLLRTRTLLDCLSMWDREYSGEGGTWKLARVAGLSSEHKNPWLSFGDAQESRLTNIMQSLLKRFPLTEGAATLAARAMRERDTAIHLPPEKLEAIAIADDMPIPAPARIKTTSRKRATRRLRSSRFVKRKK